MSPPTAHNQNAENGSKAVRVMHLTTVHPRRDTRVWVKQVSSLARQPGYDVALVVMDGTGDMPAPDANSPAVHDLGARPASRLKRVLAGNWRAFQFLRRAKPALVHFHDPELMLIMPLLRLLGCRVVYDVHEDVPRQVKNKHWMPLALRWPVSKLIEVAEFLAARLVLSGISAATETIAARFPAHKTATIHNFPILAEVNQSAALPYDERPNDIAYVGAISEVRGVLDMVEAVGQSQHADVKMQLGGVFAPPELLERAKALPGWVRVNHHGWMERAEVADVLGRVRAGLVMLHPTESYLDSLPVKMFEYMAAGMPFIASDFPFWRSLLDEYNCGLFVDPFDHAAVAEAIDWVLDNPEDAKAMGQRGKAAAEQKFNWQQDVPVLLDLYQKIL